MTLQVAFSRIMQPMTRAPWSPIDKIMGPLNSSHEGRRPRARSKEPSGRVGTQLRRERTEEGCLVGPGAKPSLPRLPGNYPPRPKMAHANGEILGLCEQY